MIIQRYLQREILATFIGVALLLSLIFLSGTFMRVLSDASAGTYPAAVVFKLFALKSIGNLAFILPLTFFIAVLLALGRFYRDSEMTVLYACGIGPEQIYRSVMRVALVVALLLVFLALYLALWSKERSHQIFDEVRSRSQVEGIAAGRFNKVGAGDELVYVESVSSDHGELSNVFAYGKPDQIQQLLTARVAYQQDTYGQRYLVFVDGNRYEGQPGAADFKVITFQEHGIRLAERDVVTSEPPRQAISSLDLWHSSAAADVAELHWRLAVPISAILFGLLAVPLSRTSPREGRYGRLFIAILVYIVYNNMLTVGKTFITRGEVNPVAGLWWVHGLVLALLAFIVWRQQRLRGPRRTKA